MPQGQKVFGYAASDPSGHLARHEFTRRETGPDDVTFKISYCGICHTDLHQILNHWKTSKYPMVPGHEVVGIVTQVGSSVQKFKVGDRVGVGCMVGSCGKCDFCDEKVEQFCPKIIWTYGGMDWDGTPTQGGYSSLMVAHQKYVLKIPGNLAMDAAAPLLCAGITVYSPMKHFEMIEKGKRLGVVGLGGLGHMAVKFGKAFGLHVTVISTSPQKEAGAKEVLGADHFIVSTDAAKMKEVSHTLDYVIDTVPSAHSLDPFLSLLKINGKLVLVGLPVKALQLAAGGLVFGRRIVGGSVIGSIAETQEMLDFCGEKDITCTIEKIPLSYINTAMERLRNKDVKYRFVLDIENTLQ